MRILILFFCTILSQNLLAQKHLYYLQKQISTSQGRELGAFLASNKNKGEVCRLAGTWATESHCEILHENIQAENNYSSQVVSNSLFALGQIGSPSSIQIISNFILLEKNKKHIQQALVCLAKCVPAEQELPKLWNDNKKLNSLELNAIASALVFSKSSSQAWLNQLLKYSPNSVLTEDSRASLASALGKSIWKNALQEKRTKEWIEQWFEKEKSVEVKVKLFRLLKMSGQISTLVSGTLHLNPRINRAACAQLVTLDSALVCPFLNETWFRACSDEFVKAWIETNFKLVTSGEALNKLKKGNFSVEEKVIIASIMNGYNDANAIAFVLNQLKVTTVTLERMQWIRCLSKQSLVIDSLLLKMENLSPAEQYTLADIALQSRGYFKSPQSLTPQDSVLLFSEDYGVVALLADYVRSESEQFKGQEWLISRLKLQLNRLNGAETIETQIALVNALNAIDSATLLSLPVAAMQEFPCYKEWRRNKKSRLKIETEDGVFVFRLDGKSCPMSVSNIKLLAKENYYNGIEFHRVVPEFVVQAGCKRGDGMSGVNYVINSEFTSREFIPYSIGMASAGRNTEGAQFFITTNYTPHLNGRYTQFGELVHGKKKIKNIEIGTRILKVR